VLNAVAADQDNGHLEKPGRKIDTDLRDRIGSGQKGQDSMPNVRNPLSLLDHCRVLADIADCGNSEALIQPR